MGIMIKVDGYVAHFIQSTGHAVNNELFHVPHWFRATGEPGVYEILKFEELPADVQKYMNEKSRDCEQTKEKDMLNYPHKQLDMFKSEEDGKT